MSRSTVTVTWRTASRRAIAWASARREASHSSTSSAASRMGRARRVALVVHVVDADREAPGGKPALPEPPSQPLGEPAQQPVQHYEVVGVGGEGMDHPILGADLGREDRTGVDPPRPGAERPSLAAEHGVQVGLFDDRNVADQVELVVVEPGTDAVGHLGEDVDVMGREEGLLRPPIPRGPTNGRTDGPTDRLTDGPTYCPTDRPWSPLRSPVCSPRHPPRAAAAAARALHAGSSPPRSPQDRRAAPCPRYRERRGRTSAVR